jgi:hypothetical protein
MLKGDSLFNYPPRKRIKEKKAKELKSPTLLFYYYTSKMDSLSYLSLAKLNTAALSYLIYQPVSRPLITYVANVVSNVTRYDPVMILALARRR